MPLHPASYEAYRKAKSIYPEEEIVLVLSPNGGEGYFTAFDKDTNPIATLCDTSQAITGLYDNGDRQIRRISVHADHLQSWLQTLTGYGFHVNTVAPAALHSQLHNLLKPFYRAQAHPQTLTPNRSES